MITISFYHLLFTHVQAEPPMMEEHLDEMTDVAELTVNVLWVGNFSFNDFILGFVPYTHLTLPTKREV